MIKIGLELHGIRITEVDYTRSEIGSIVYKCDCLRCGARRSLSENSIRSRRRKKTKGCMACRKFGLCTVHKDLEPGDIVSGMTVISRTTGKDSKDYSVYQMQCSCGSIHRLSRSYILARKRLGIVRCAQCKGSINGQHIQEQKEPFKQGS